MHINICSILIDMIIRVEQLIDGKQLYSEVFENSDHLRDIFSATYPDSDNSSSRLPTVLWNLMETTANNFGENNETLLEMMMFFVETTLDKYAEYLEKFLNNQDSSSERTSVTTFGGEGKILGKQPVKIAGVVLAFLKTNHERLDMALYKNKILQTFLKLMIKYHWNNIFHNYVTNIVSQVLENRYPYAQISLYENDFIQDFMLDAIKQKTHPKSGASNKSYTLGY